MNGEALSRRLRPGEACPGRGGERGAAAYLRRHRGDEKATSALSRVEVVRALLGGGVSAVAKARRQLGRLYVVPLDRALLDDAATLGAGHVLRSLDAIHLAAAKRLGPDLRSVITYDHRMHQAADAVGLPVVAPS